MSKETYYFSHDYNAMQDPKMIELWGECGLQGVGFYWILIESLHAEPSGKISELQLKTLLKMYYNHHEGEHMFNKIQQVLNTTKLLIKDEDGMLFSSRVLSHKKERINISELRSKAGKVSAERRNKNSNKCSTPVQQVFNNIKERKGKERKVNNHTGEVFKKFSKWVKNIEGIKDPIAYSKFIFGKHSELAISKAMNDRTCDSLSKFNSLVEFYGTKKL